MEIPYLGAQKAQISLAVITALLPTQSHLLFINNISRSPSNEHDLNVLHAVSFKPKHACYFVRHNSSDYRVLWTSIKVVLLPNTTPHYAHVHMLTVADIDSKHGMPKLSLAQNDDYVSWWAVETRRFTTGANHQRELQMQLYQVYHEEQSYNLIISLAMNNHLVRGLVLDLGSVLMVSQLPTWR